MQAGSIDGWVWGGVALCTRGVCPAHPTLLVFFPPAPQRKTQSKIRPQPQRNLTRPAFGWAHGSPKARELNMTEFKVHQKTEEIPHVPYYEYQTAQSPEYQPDKPIGHGAFGIVW